MAPLEVPETPVEAPPVPEPTPDPETASPSALDPSTLSPELREAMEVVVAWMDEWQVREMVIMGQGTVALSNAPEKRPTAKVNFVVC